MTEQERLVFKEDIKKLKKVYIAVIVIFGFIMMGLLTCNSQKYNRLKGEYNILEKDYLKQKDGVKVFEETRKREKDSLNSEIKRRETENKELVADTKKVISNIEKIKSKPINVPKDVIGLTKYFNERYKTKENKVVEDKVGLAEFTAYDVSYELEEGDRVKEVLPLKDKVIDNQQYLITNLEKDKQDVNTKLISAEQDVKLNKDLNASAENNINNLEKQVSKLKIKSTLTKILIPASFILGGYIGFQIAK